MIANKPKKNFYYVDAGEYWTREEFRKNFSGSDDLFNYCWRCFLMHAAGVDEVAAFLDEIAAAAVNDENSKFYIYG